MEESFTRWIVPATTHLPASRGIPRNLSSSESGFVLYLDRECNGDLSDVTPLKFDARTLRSETEVSNGRLRWSVRFELMKSEGGPSVRIVDGGTRQGTIVINQRLVPFTLHGSRARYDWPYLSLTLDRLGNGTTEDFPLSEPYVNSGNKTYQFSVDPAGDSLTLKPAEWRAERASLLPGTAAPDFEFTDIDGHAGKLRDFGGRTLLLEFWSTSCAPCRAEAPRLVELRKKLGPGGFDIVGIADDPSEKCCANS